jgi:phage terminase large subunit
LLRLRPVSDSDYLPYTEEEWAEFAAENILRIRTDPCWFLETAYGMQLDIWQREMFEAMSDPIRHHYGLPTIRNHPSPYNNDKPLTKFTIRAMHGPGKTFGAAAALIWFHHAFKGLSPATAPTIKQLRTRLWPRIRTVKAMADPFWGNMYEVMSQTVQWRNQFGKLDPDWGVVAETGATPENLQGYHDEFMLIVCDEASGIDEEMFPVIEGAMSTGVIVLLLLIGNPTKLIGTFADSHLKPKVAKYYHQIHVDLEKTTRVSKQWVKEMGEKYGITSPVYLVRCLGEFAEEDDNQLFSLAWLESARNKEYKADGSIPRKRISVDVADGGGNFTVITRSTKYQSFTLLKRQTQHSFPGATAVTQCCDEVERIWYEDKMLKENGDDIVVDSLGVGAGVTSELVTRGLPVIRYMGGARSDDINLWRNRRVQSYMVTRDHFRDNKIVFDENFVDDDEWDDLYGQLCAIKRKPGMEKIEDLMTKQEMVDKGIKSPDRADSIAMQSATQSPVLLPGLVDMPIVGAQMETASYDGSISESF